MSTPDEQLQTQLRNMEARAGRSREALAAFVNAHPTLKHGALVALCKAELGLGHGDANTLVHLTRGTDGGSVAAATVSEGGDPADTWYAGKKAALRPVHDAVLAVVAGLGGDVEHAPKKTWVSLRRRKQFAMVGPANATQVEIGLNLKGVAGEGRLELLPPGGMCSHRIRVGSVAEVDAFVADWLRRAWEAAG